MNWANRYIFVSIIGKGSFGTVYKVEDRKLSEGHESIKVLKEIAVTNMDQDEIDKCTREGKLLSSLSCLYIVQFFDSFCSNDFYCIITELCDGGDLDQLIKATKKSGIKLDEKQIVQWFVEIMQGLCYIHQRKILHRDMKPKNVFLKDNSIKIGDFGLSRILNYTLDMASSFVGTLIYMSPEVHKCDGYNATSDVWSAGIILYEMCALKHAYNGTHIGSIRLQIVKGPCPTIPENYSKELQNVLEWVLIKDPNIRPTSFEVLQIEYLQKELNVCKWGSEDLSPESVSTPKKQVTLTQQMTAVKEAAETRNGVDKFSHENQEWQDQSKERSSTNSLPFSMMRRQSSLTVDTHEKMQEKSDMRSSGSSSQNLLKTYPNGKERVKTFSDGNKELNRTLTIPPNNNDNKYDILHSDGTANNNVSIRFKDDIDKDPYGKKAKEMKIENLERSCLDIIDRRTLMEALNHLDSGDDQGYDTQTLSDICKSDTVADLVKQLYLLKK